MAEDTKIGETAPKTPESGRAEQARSVGELLADMRAARKSFHEGKLPEKDYVDKIIQLDRSLTIGLTSKFNAQSGFNVTLPERPEYLDYRKTLSGEGAASLPTQDAEQAIIEALRKQSTRPEPAFYTDENEMASRREIMALLLKNHPHLSEMTLADAAQIIDRTSKGEEVDWKYGEASGTVLICAALTMVNISRDELKTVNPSLHRSIEASAPEYIRDVVSDRILGKTEQDEEFVAWEAEKRDQVVAAFRADKSLMEDIAKIKPLLDSQDENDLLSQHRLRDSINQRVLGIYAKVYDTPELLRPGVMNTTYAPIEKLYENDVFGYSGGVSGVKQEDYTFVRTTLFHETLLRDPMDTKSKIGEKFLFTLNEEARHAVDNIYSDRLVAGEMDKNHPAFNHTNIIFFNNFNYIKDGEAYGRQYLERTAKEAAMEVTAVVGGDIFPAPPPEPLPPGSEVITLEGMTIRGNIKP